MAIGKSMLSGKLLYTEIHDQKGPFIFFLHEWAAALSSKTFFGIYLLQIFCCFGFLSVSYRLMRMFAKHRICLITTCVVGVFTYASDFMFYGDTVEELSLPILLYILFETLRYAKYCELPRSLEAFFIGIGVAVIFWTKFTLLAMCVGALAVLLFLAWQRGQMRLLLRCLAWVFAGVAGTTVGVLLYFIIHGNIQDLYYSYFYFNLFTYVDAGNIGVYKAWWFAPLKWTGWALLIASILPWRVSRDVKFAVATCWGAQLLFFVLFRVFIYYFLIGYVFAPLVIYFVRDVRSRVVIASCAVLLTSYAIITNYNLMTLVTGNFPTAILPLAKIVNDDKDPEKQVLTIRSYDTGIYTLTDCLPPIKFFVTPNAYVEELITEQAAYLESRKAKYLIMKTEEPVYYGTFHPDLTHDYDCICETSNACRFEFLLHPMQFLWSLGYMKGVVEHFYTPNHSLINYRLYRRK
jgi:hypothetical protein